MEEKDFIYVCRALYNNGPLPVYTISDSRERILETYDKVFEDTEMKSLKLYRIEKLRFYASVSGGDTIGNIVSFNNPVNPRLV